MRRPTQLIRLAPLSFLSLSVLAKNVLSKCHQVMNRREKKSQTSGASPPNPHRRGFSPPDPSGDLFLRRSPIPRRPRPPSRNTRRSYKRNTAVKWQPSTVGRTTSPPLVVDGVRPHLAATTAALTQRNALEPPNDTRQQTRHSAHSVPVVVRDPRIQPGVPGRGLGGDGDPLASSLRHGDHRVHVAHRREKLEDEAGEGRGRSSHLRVRSLQGHQKV